MAIAVTQVIEPVRPVDLLPTLIRPAGRSVPTDKTIDG
jgi:hypothetical protein